MRLVNCSLQWSVSLLNTRNLVRPIAHSDTNSTSSNVETPLVDNGFVKVIPRCIRLAIGGPFETGSRVFGGPIAGEAFASFIDARQKADCP
jgi:hypothetical protein